MLKTDKMWANWPDEILVIIFSKLDIKSLTNCLHVNKHWRDVVEYCCQRFNLWEKVIEEIVDNTGLKLKEKSTLNLRDLFNHAQQWYNIKDCNISYHFHYTSKSIRNICVLKDNLIVVSNMAIKYYDINNFNLNKTVRATCLKYEETYAFSAEVILPRGRVHTGNLLVLTNKLHYSDCKCTTGQNMILCKTYLVKIHLNSCYFIDTVNALRVFRADYCRWDDNVLARHYGVPDSIIDLTIFKGDVYVLLKKGDVLQLDKDCRKFVKIYQFNTSLINVCTKPILFHTSSILCSVTSTENMEIITSSKKEQVAVTCPGLSCAIEHGPVILMAYEGGMIEIYLTRKLRNKVTTPELRFHLKSYIEAGKLDDEIKGLDIYEGTKGHHLFVATNTDVYEFILSVD